MKLADERATEQEDNSARDGRGKEEHCQMAVVALVAATKCQCRIAFSPDSPYVWALYMLIKLVYEWIGTLLWQQSGP